MGEIQIYNIMANTVTRTTAPAMTMLTKKEALFPSRKDGRDIILFGDNAIKTLFGFNRLNDKDLVRETHG